MKLPTSWYQGTTFSMGYAQKTKNSHWTGIWKVRLNIHGRQQVKGVHYWEMYSPMVHWASIQFALALSILNGWYTAQMDFVLAYPQADFEETICMEVPKDFQCEGYDPGEVVLELHKNLYGQKQAGQVWYKHLTQLLTTVHRFTQC